MDIAGGGNGGASILKRIGTNGVMTSLADTADRIGFSGDGGPATKACLNAPDSTVFDAAGNLYVADQYNCRIRQIDTNGIINTIAGNGQFAFFGDNGPATNAALGFPFGLAFDAAGNLFTSDADGHVREIHFAGLPWLTLSNMSAVTAGSYAVIISGTQGSVTSRVASITLAPATAPPQINLPNGEFVTTNFSFSVAAAVGQTVAVDGSTNLSDWTALVTNYVASSPFYFADPAAPTFGCRFYRARLLIP
jgi:hypothetical protein